MISRWSNHFRRFGKIMEITGNSVSHRPLRPPDSAPGSGRPSPSIVGKPATGGSYTGDITIFENFHSAILGNDRDVYVYLPPGYHQNKDKQYPVLYMQDGQNVFNRETSFGGVEWGADETAEKLIREGRMKEVIIVGVSNTPDRMSEYTHVKDPEHGGGNLQSYADFLIKELKPFIDSRYKTSMAAEDTAVAGSSLGGLSALWLGWNFSTTFGLIGALSPSIWWAGKDIIGRIEKDPQQKGPSKIWLDMGTRESDQDDNHNGICDHIELAREMGTVFLEKGYDFGKELFYYEDPGATHSEWYWGNRLDKVFLALFGKDRT
jgi:predicted alpha/beta superfamily hydrolase